MIDCLIIGAGPAGLTAAIYLARFHLAVRVVDAGQSRAALIPRTHNHAGFPGGISGRDLLQRMRDQAEQFGTCVESTTAERLGRIGDGFIVHSGNQTCLTRAVLLATGVVNNRPPIAPEIHDVAISRGLLRYCPICDGYEVTDQRVGVIGTGSHAVREATFLRMYTRDVTLISPVGRHDLTESDKTALADLGVVLLDGPCEPLWIDGDEICVSTPTGVTRVDTAYPALGSVVRSELAMALGAEAAKDGCLNRRLPSAHDHSRPVRCRRRHDGARSDQSCDGGGQRRCYHYSQRSCRAFATATIKSHRHGPGQAEGRGLRAPVLSV